MPIHHRRFRVASPGSRGKRSTRPATKTFVPTVQSVRASQWLYDDDDDDVLNEGIDWSTWLLFGLLLSKILVDYYQLTQGVEFSEGLFYDPKLLRGLLMLMMVGPGALALLFHSAISVKVFQGTPMRLFSVFTCVALSVIAFNVLFVLVGGFAHVHANAIDYYCVRNAKGNEELCQSAKERMAEMPEHYRRLVRKSSGFYSEVRGKRQTADLALLGLLRELGQRKTE